MRRDTFGEGLDELKFSAGRYDRLVKKFGEFGQYVGTLRGQIPTLWISRASGPRVEFELMGQRYHICLDFDTASDNAVISCWRDVTPHDDQPKYEKRAAIEMDIHGNVRAKGQERWSTAIGSDDWSIFRHLISPE